MGTTPSPTAATATVGVAAPSPTAAASGGEAMAVGGDVTAAKGVAAVAAAAAVAGAGVATVDALAAAADADTAAAEAIAADATVAPVRVGSIDGISGVVGREDEAMGTSGDRWTTKAGSGGGGRAEGAMEVAGPGEALKKREQIYPFTTYHDFFPR